MAFHAVIFDVGGVLELPLDIGVTANWEHRLGLAAGELDKRMGDIWRAGSVGTVTEAEVAAALAERLHFEADQCDAFLSDMWREYLGSANEPLIDYARALRPRYRTGIISNSFVGARAREQAAYGFEDLVDEIVYSHEVGYQKPDARIYTLACHRLRVHPSTAVFIDDHESAVQGARAAGLHGLVHAGDNVATIQALHTLLAGCRRPRDQAAVTAPRDHPDGCA